MTGQMRKADPTWRNVIAEAVAAIPHATEHRDEVMRAGYLAGLSLGAIADAAGMARSSVDKIVSARAARRALLDTPAEGAPRLLTCTECGTALLKRSPSGLCGFCNLDEIERAA